MPSTTRRHDGRATTVCPQASLVVDDTVAVHPAERVFDPAADGREGTLGRVLWWGECPPRRLWLGGDNGEPLAQIALAAPVLRETTAGWDGRALPLREACSSGVPLIGGTHEAHRARLIEPEAVGERVTRLLTAVVCRLVLGIGWAGARSLRTIRPTRGATGPPSGRLAASRTAQASAWRAGSPS